MMNIFRGGNIGKKGFILVTALLAAFILLVLAVSYISRVVTEYKLMLKTHNSTAAINVAEAGAGRAIWEILYNDSAFNGWAYTGDPGSDQTWTIDNARFNDPAGNAAGYYDAFVSVPAGSNTKTIAVTGYVPSKTAYDEKRTVTVNYYSQGLFNFSNAVAANGLENGNPINGSIKMDGSSVYVDSYDSSVGAYGDPGQTETMQGSIVTNGDIQLSAGNLHVRGNAYYGGKFSGNPKQSVSGATGKLEAPLTLDFPQDSLNTAKTVNNNANIQINSIGANAEGWLPLDGSNNLSIKNGAVITLPGGTYYFNSISMSAGANAIQAAGPSTVYVDGGRIDISGIANVNSSGSNPLPANLIIYSNYSGSDGILFAGNYYFYGAIYAPFAGIVLGGNSDYGDFYGSIICKTIRLQDGAKIHYDTALADVSSSASNSRTVSWQET